MLPTLLQKNKIVFPSHCGDMVAMDYIMEVLKNSDTTFVTSPSLTYKDKIHIIKADTGSGKSTILPAFLARYYRSKDVHHKRGASTRKRIVVTQPRIITAEQISGDLSSDDTNYPELKHHFTVGVNTSKIKRPSSNIVFSTVGSLVESIRRMDAWEDVASSYHCIIVDEAHEMSVELELLLVMLKRVYQSILPRRLPHLIITSATLDETMFLNYFGLERDHSFIQVAGFTYPIDVCYYDESGDGGTPPPVETAVKLLLQIHTVDDRPPTPNDDVIIFFASSKEIAGAQKQISNLESLSDVQIESLTRADVLFRTSQKRPIITDMLPTKRRRVFLATNAAEVGITIHTLGYVIDTGMANVAMSFPYTRAVSLVRCPITKHNFAQRSGRVGRKAPGTVLTTYPRVLFESMQTAPTPAILLQGCAPIFLWLIKYNTLDLPTPPSFEDFQENVFIAVEFGFIRNEIPTGEEKERLVLTPDGLDVMEWGLFSSHSFNRVLLSALQSTTVCPLDILYVLVGLNSPDIEMAVARGKLDKRIASDTKLNLPLPKSNGFVKVLSYMYYFYHLISSNSSVQETLQNPSLYQAVKTCIETVNNAVTNVFQSRIYRNYENRYINTRTIEPNIIQCLHEGFKFDTFSLVSKGLFKNINGTLCEGPSAVTTTAFEGSRNGGGAVRLMSYGTRIYINGSNIKQTIPDIWCIV